jgi:hypothetical protein
LSIDTEAGLNNRGKHRQFFQQASCWWPEVISLYFIIWSRLPGAVKQTTIKQTDAVDVSAYDADFDCGFLNHG